MGRKRKDPYHNPQSNAEHSGKQAHLQRLASKADVPPVIHWQEQKGIKQAKLPNLDLQGNPQRLQQLHQILHHYVLQIRNHATIVVKSVTGGACHETTGNVRQL